MKDNSEHEISESSCLCASVLKKDAGVEDRGFNTETQRLRGTEFKMTEIGLIPEDWECCKIGELAKICTGNRNTQDKNDNGRYPFYVRSPIVERIDEYGFNTEGVVTVGDGVGTGKVFHYVNGCFGLHQRCYLIDSFDVRLNSKYFYKVFSERFFDRVMQMTAKSSVDSVRREMITEMLIPVPPLHEQKAIAEALSDVDELLAAMTTLIEKKRAIKQGAMQELLTGKKRLPGFGGKWIEKRLGDCALIKARIGWQGLTTDEYLENGPYYLITGSDFRDGKVNWSQCYYVDKSRYEQDKNIQIQKNDVLVSKDGTIGKVAFLDEIPGEGTLNSGVFVIRTRDKEIEQLYMAWVFLSKWFDDFINRLVAGSTIVHLYQKDIVGFEFPVPPTIAEQKAIADVLSDMDAEITALETKKTKYESIKQSMMQELLTGRMRMKD